jgi:protein RecA
MGRRKGGKNKKTIFDKKMDNPEFKKIYKEVELSKESKALVKKGLQEAKEGKIEPLELSKEQQERKEKLNTVLRDINKQYNDPTMMKFASEEPPKESIPVGNKAIDEFLGGLAVIGNFIIIYGSEGVGKSTLAYNQVAEAQRNGKICAYIDLEHTIDKTRLVQFDVKLDSLILVENCETAEQAMDITIKLAKERVVDLIIIDSIQAMSPHDEQFEGKGEKERSMSADEMALLARKMGKFLRRTAPFIYKGKVAVLLIGQIRTGGLGSFITHETLTGGHGVKHWSILTVSMRKGQGADAPTEKYEEDGKKKERRIGFDCVLKIEKTKKSTSKPELSELHIPFYFDVGFGG